MKETELIEDLIIYPRNTVDEVWVGLLANKLRAGVIFPPILVDKKTKKIVDGFHRRRAYVRVHGAGCDIPAETMSFKNDSEMALESMRRNAIHGKPLSTIDQIKCADIGKRLGITFEVIANTLGVELPKFQDKVEMRTAYGPSGEFVGVKNTMVNPGKVDTDQKKAINAASGNIQFHAKSLYNLIRVNVLDLAAPKVLEDLYTLRDLLNEKLPKKDKEV